MAMRPKLHGSPARPTHTPDNRPSAAARGYDHNWRRVRLDYLRDNPLCVHCLRQGIPTPAKDVDHIIPRRKGGTDDPHNLQSLCHSHHARKTAREDRR